MKPLFETPWKQAVLAGVLLLFGLAAAQGEERTIEQHNCALTPPAGWEVPPNMPPQPALAAIYRKPDGSALLMLIVDEKNKLTEGMNDRVAAELEKGIAAGGAGPRTWGKISTLGEVKAYERLGSLTVAGKPTSFYVRIVPVAGKTYSLQAMRFDGNAAEDSEVQQAFASFRFLQPPPQLPANAAAFVAGRVAGHLVVAVLILFLIVGVPLIIVLVIRSRKAKAPIPPPTPAPPIPPPLPPQA